MKTLFEEYVFQSADLLNTRWGSAPLEVDVVNLASEGEGDYSSETTFPGTRFARNRPVENDGSSSRGSKRTAKAFGSWLHSENSWPVVGLVSLANRRKASICEGLTSGTDGHIQPLLTLILNGLLAQIGKVPGEISEMSNVRSPTNYVSVLISRPVRGHTNT